jgi:3-hydroxybutyryl-CoA dehydrogenase
MIETIGVVGAGQMGSGIAHVCALAGYRVRLSDLDEDVLRRSLSAIERNMSRQVARGKITSEEQAAALGRIETGLDYAMFADCDLVIESVVEDEAVKREILKALIAVLKPDAIIATNTSSLSITRLAAATDRPGRFMGMHFMNPVPVMELIELIRGIATDEETFATVRGVVERLGKTSAMAESSGSARPRPWPKTSRPSSSTAFCCR